MVQGIFGGGTSYRDQSLLDIVEDIGRWINYEQKLRKFMDESKEKLFETGFWNTIPYDLRMIFEGTIFYCRTIDHDLLLVKNSIENGSVMIRDSNLLDTIGRQSVQYNVDYGKVFYQSDDGWQDYDDMNFRLAEQMYREGRDFFVTLQDASNAGKRINDYVTNIPINNTTITINGNANGAQIQQGNQNSVQNMTCTKNVDYLEILKYLSQIKDVYRGEEFDNVFGIDADSFRETVDQTIIQVKNEEDISLVRRSVEFLKDAANKATGALIAAGLLKILGHISDLVGK